MSLSVLEPLVTSYGGSTRTKGVELQPNLVTKHLAALAWLKVFQKSFGHTPYLLEVRNPQSTLLGHLPLCLVQSRLFGRFLVSLPYLNSAGIETSHPEVAQILVNRAVDLANELDVDHLELRHEQAVESPHFNGQIDEKVHMRLALPAVSDTLWKQLKAKVRNQVRKGESHDLRIEWGREERLLHDFYGVFSHNMRDLGTPVYSRNLFSNILDEFPTTELAVTYLGAQKPVAAAILHHSKNSTNVPSASSLRHYNSTNANMWMYWQLLSRAIERGSDVFDFGRSTIGEGTYRFKKQWGAEPSPATWQLYSPNGKLEPVRPNNPKYRLMIRAWQKLPVWIANRIGPKIVRGIP